MRTKQLIFRWSLVTGGVIALFWAIWYLITGSVPIVTSIKITKDFTYVLPFGISRWWDILIGPIWSTITILILRSKIKKNRDLTITLVCSLIIGLGWGLGFDLSASLILGLVLGLILGLVLGLNASLLVPNLVFGLGIGLGFGLIFGLGFGLVFWLSFGLGFGLIDLGKYTIKQIKLKFWTKIWNWLMVKED